MAVSDKGDAHLARMMSAANWSYWANLATVELLAACILSMGLEPQAVRAQLSIENSESMVPVDRAAAGWLPLEFLAELKRRAQIAKSHLSEALPHCRTAGDDEISYVRLTEFRAWGEALPVPLDFPDDFPRVRSVRQEPNKPDKKQDPAPALDILGTRIIGRTEIMLGYDDFVRLFNVTDPRDFAPGLVVRTDGVYVIPPPDDVDLTPEERATLTDHPTGNLSEPALPLPCPLATLEAFADRYGLGCAVDPFVMMTVVNKLTWTYAQVEHQTAQGFIRDFLPGLMRLRGELHRQHEVEANDSKKVVQRAVLDELNEMLAQIEHQTSQGFIRDFLPGLMRLRGELRRQYEIETNDSKKVVQRDVLDRMNAILATIDNPDADFDGTATPAADAGGRASARSENATLRIVAAMLALLRDKDGARFPSDAKVIEQLVGKYGAADGISKSNLEKVFPAAKQVAGDDLKPKSP